MALNCLVQIQQRDAGADAAGQPAQTWSPVFSAWAEIRHPSGVEQIRAGAQISAVSASIKMRQRDGVVAGMRAVHWSTIYLIHAVLPDKVDRAAMFLVCEVKAP